MDKLEAFVRDLAEHGVRFDLTPTVYNGGTSGDMYSQMVDYVRRIDESIRQRARHELGEIDAGS